MGLAERAPIPSELNDSQVGLLAEEHVTVAVTTAGTGQATVARPLLDLGFDG
jgi:hypothetical protein